MFDNIGNKIKGVAKAFCWIGIIGSIITGIILLAINSYYNPTAGLGIGIALGGSLMFWISSLFLFGFGELLERTKSIDETLNHMDFQSRINNNSSDKMQGELNENAGNEKPEKSNVPIPVDQYIRYEVANSKKSSSSEAYFLYEIANADSLYSIYETWKNYDDLAQRYQHINESIIQKRREALQTGELSATQLDDFKKEIMRELLM